MIIIEIFGTVLIYNLLRSNTMEILTGNCVSENKGNMLLSHNVKNSQIKYSKDELSEIRKTLKQDFTPRQINVEAFKVIRKYWINRRGKRSGKIKIRLKQHQLGSQ